MADSVIGSKEVALGVIGLVLANIVKATGSELPVSPDQVYAVFISAMILVRIIWTSGKIQSFLPK